MSVPDNITILVTPEVLSRQAQSVLTRTASIERRFSSIENIVNRSGSYWTGEAGQTHRRVYTESKEGIEEVLAELKETANVLSETAQTYSAAETRAQETAAGLPTNVIV